jgi:hypothetical protein
MERVPTSSDTALQEDGEQKDRSASGGPLDPDAGSEVPRRVRKASGTSRPAQRDRQPTASQPKRSRILSMAWSRRATARAARRALALVGEAEGARTGQRPSSIATPRSRGEDRALLGLSMNGPGSTAPRPRQRRGDARPAPPASPAGHRAEVGNTDGNCPPEPGLGAHPARHAVGEVAERGTDHEVVDRLPAEGGLRAGGMRPRPLTRAAGRSWRRARSASRPPRCCRGSDALRRRGAVAVVRMPLAASPRAYRPDAHRSTEGFLQRSRSPARPATTSPSKQRPGGNLGRCWYGRADRDRGRPRRRPSAAPCGQSPQGERCSQPATSARPRRSRCARQRREVAKHGDRRVAGLYSRFPPTKRSRGHSSRARRPVMPPRTPNAFAS